MITRPCFDATFRSYVVFQSHPLIYSICGGTRVACETSSMYPQRRLCGASFSTTTHALYRGCLSIPTKTSQQATSPLTGLNGSATIFRCFPPRLVQEDGGLVSLFSTNEMRGSPHSDLASEPSALSMLQRPLSAENGQHLDSIRLRRLPTQHIRAQEPHEAA